MRFSGGAGLDDLEEEPAKQRDWKPVNPLFGLDNVVITPHAAYYSEEAIRTVRDFAAHEVARVLTRAAAALASERGPARDGPAPPPSVSCAGAEPPAIAPPSVAPRLTSITPRRRRPFPHPEHAPVVPAVIPRVDPIRIHTRSDLVFSGGRNWVRTSDFSLVRRVLYR